MVRASRVATVVASVVLAAGPLAAQGTSGVERDLDANYATFRDAYARLDADLVAGLYAADAVYLSAGEVPVRGRAPIRSVFAGFFEQIRADGATLAIDFRILRRDATPDLATDVGYYRLAVIRAGRTGPPSYGRFVTVSRREADGRFRFVVDSYTGADSAEWDAAAKER